ncbi:carboxypeptidase Taq [Oikeobacillus pervagus]|uniref:Metal-dependent carboxypeptidase n=1 Tax=Oikeobacillus pervagus TaxID=1325931 RepID=A0AAJ1SXN7_9BACI|nr:carboxypeptidase M32 [Oikeobacillus pervagus]MDQ0213642.1 carboxypeptidase Taq [Oikeobacillus pervagus]
MGYLEENEQDFLKYVKKMRAYQEAINLLFWDLRTGAPKKGVNQRAEVYSVLSSEVFKMSTSEEMAAYIANLSPHENSLPEITKRILQECKREYNQNKKIPHQLYKEYIVLQSKSENVWEQAREENNFKLFQPYLEKIVDYKKRFIEYWGYDEQKYDTLLDLYEPGMTVAKLDQVFAELRNALIPLVQKIKLSPQNINHDFLFQRFPIENQKAFSMEVLKRMGYDFEAGRLDETIHPFEISLNPGDVRITTRYDEYDWRLAVFGTIHEGGHAIYEQNISKELIATPLCNGTSMGIHESQSLFYENFIGRHYGFWTYHYPLLKNYSNGQFDSISLDQFYQAVNVSKPTLIRIEADELTYCLHIIIRYEIEKALIHDQLSVKELPRVWNEKYKEYLGIQPEDDRTGVLQDVHWAAGDFGYFPSYALGFLYAAQFYQQVQKDIPEFPFLLEKGNLQPIRKWLTTHIHQYGKLKKPLEILQEATGEGINPKYLIDYLTKKYGAVYSI